MRGRSGAGQREDSPGVTDVPDCLFDSMPISSADEDVTGIDAASDERLRTKGTMPNIDPFVVAAANGFKQFGFVELVVFHNVSAMRK